MRRRVRDVQLAQGPQRAPTNRPVLLVANHTSWWDGFLVRRLFGLLRPGAPVFTIMLDRELNPRPWLRWLGCVGMTPGSFSSLRGLRRQVGALASTHPTAGFSYFAQGKIWPSTRRPLGFEPGVRALAKATQAAEVVPVSIHLEAGRHPVPTAWVAAGPALRVTGRASDSAWAEAEVERSLDLTLGFLAKYGEDADAHAPEWRALHRNAHREGA